jgi:hypothetical protein
VQRGEKEYALHDFAAMMTHDEKEDLLEALSDLKHDLGKYIKLPVTMLPGDADSAEVARQVKQAIQRTRRGPEGDRPAADIFGAFTAEWDEVIRAFRGYRTLCRALARAISWSTRVDEGPQTWSRKDVEADLKMVGETIQALMQEIESAG